MLRTIASTAFVVDGAVIHLHPVGSVAKALSSPNSLQLLQWNRSADTGIIVSIEKLEFEISTTTLGGCFPIGIRYARLVVLYNYVSGGMPFERHSNVIHQLDDMFRMDLSQSYHRRRIRHIAYTWSRWDSQDLDNTDREKHT